MVPSGAAFATALAPVVPPAPGRFSITNVWPTCFPTCSNTTRAATSLAVPAPSGTTTATARAGHSCADAAPGTAIAAHASQSAACNNARGICRPALIAFSLGFLFNIMKPRSDEAKVR